MRNVDLASNKAYKHKRRPPEDSSLDNSPSKKAVPVKQVKIFEANTSPREAEWGEGADKFSKEKKLISSVLIKVKVNH